MTRLINKVKDNHLNTIKYNKVNNLIHVDVDISNYEILDKKFDGFIYEINHHFLSFYLSSCSPLEKSKVEKLLFNKNKINYLSIIFYKSPYSLFNPSYYIDKYLRDFSISEEKDIFEFLNQINSNYEYEFFVKNYSVRNEYKNNKTFKDGKLLFDFYKKHAEENILFISSLLDTGFSIRGLIYSDSSGSLSNRDYYNVTLEEELAVINYIKEKNHDLTYYIEMKSIDKIDDSFYQNNKHYQVFEGVNYLYRDINNYFSLNEMNYSYKDKDIIINYLLSDNYNVIDHFSSFYQLLNNYVSYIYFPLIVKDYSQVNKYNEDIASLLIYKDDNFIFNNLSKVVEIYNDIFIQGHYVKFTNIDIPTIGIISNNVMTVIIDKRNIKKDLSIKYKNDEYLLKCSSSDFVFLKLNININEK
ncbi:MAG: hypothetical protein ACI31G_00100 [Bacilli bacterium]